MLSIKTKAIYRLCLDEQERKSFKKCESTIKNYNKLEIRLAAERGSIIEFLDVRSAEDDKQLQALAL